jgi:hypothetical protein
MTAPPRSVADLIATLIGPIVWAGHFFMLYGAEALICTKGIGLDDMRLFAAAATAIAVGILVVAIVRSRRPMPSSNDRAPALREISSVLSLISIGAILAVALPTASIPTCTNPVG